MKIKNIEVNFNFLDADDMERFEEEAKWVVSECERKSKQSMSYSQSIREQCKIIDTFFDNVFGDGISVKLFKGRSNLEEHLKSFEDIVKEKMEQQKRMEGNFSRYQPNREQRRNKQHYNYRNNRKW